MLKRFVKPVLFVCLLATFIAGGIQAGIMPIEDEGGPLCTQSSAGGCDNAGCEGKGGVCGRATSQGHCWCLY